jgi:hypothetical protein
MKKALALVLALVLALSMAVSAFALTLKDLTDLTPADPAKKVITVVDADDKEVLYTDAAGTYYIALTDEEWYDVKVTTNGCVDAKLVEFDPETMEIKGNLVPVWSMTKKGDVVEGAAFNGLTYEEAKEMAKYHNDINEVTYYGVKLMTNVNVIEITIADNYTVHYLEGEIEITAKKKVDGKAVNFGGVIEVINDVVNFEYEMVKWTAANFDDEKALTVNDEGYSDYDAAQVGYDVNDEKYEIEANRKDNGAAVVSTTAFRAIEGKDLAVAYTAFEGNRYEFDLAVALYDIVKGQKGVNFQAYAKPAFVDANKNKVWDLNEELTAIEVGFYGDQVVKGAFEITLDLNCDWFELREYFGLEVEEDDIVSYYVVDANGKVVGGKEVDYMTADLSENVEFTIKGENAKLGQYKVVLEVPAAEVGEANPNTGAESVVGVVAALAVVSVATAAAVSLKK